MKMQSVLMAQNEQTLGKIRSEMYYLYGKELQDSLYTESLHSEVRDYLNRRLDEESLTMNWFPIVWFDTYPLFDFRVITDIIREDNKIKITVGLKAIKEEVA